MMGREINLLDRYPRTRRPIEERSQQVTNGHIRIGRQFGREYFDGDRMYGYGGYSYHPRFWQETVKRFRDYYQLMPDARVLDVGCAKGYMLYDFTELMPGLKIAGLDISNYAIGCAKESVFPCLQVGSATELPFDDGSFDLVISINTVHNLYLEDCKQALREIERVSSAHAFVTMDAWRSEEEREQLMKWNLTAVTYMHTEEWVELFEQVGYSGDYYWFIA